MSNEKPNYLLLSSTIISVGLIYYSYQLYKKYCLMMNKINQIKIANNNNPVKFFNKYMQINYSYMNQNYILNIPYDKTQIANMVNYNVYAVYNEDYVEITQQPGIPYLITADALEVDYISVNNSDTENENRYYIKCPMYLKENE